jgi:glycosyltransferase involved in cell wall biosynthesis
MKVSVVIPVYNAERYVRFAVESAVTLPQVLEVNLVEDGSSDNSLEICEKLASEFPIVRLLKHRNNANLGAGASRNLGCIEAKADWIAFLDADDFFLESRFDRTEMIICKGNVDAVGEAVGSVLQKGVGASEFEIIQDELTTVNDDCAQEHYFEHHAPIGNRGYFCTDGWTIKKSLLKDVGWFNEELVLHQDTDLFLKVSMVGIILFGEIKRPVAMRRVHAANRITEVTFPRKRFFSKSRMWISVIRWAKSRLLGEEVLILKRQHTRHFLVGQVEYVPHVNDFPLLKLFFYMRYSFGTLIQPVVFRYYYRHVKHSILSYGKICVKSE